MAEPGKYWFCQEVLGSNQEDHSLNQEDFGLDQEDFGLDQDDFGLDQEGFGLDQEDLVWTGNLHQIGDDRYSSLPPIFLISNFLDKIETLGVRDIFFFF